MSFSGCVLGNWQEKNTLTDDGTKRNSIQGIPLGGDRGKAKGISYTYMYVKKVSGRTYILQEQCHICLLSKFGKLCKSSFIRLLTSSVYRKFGSCT